MSEDLTYYDIKPEGFINYLRYYGHHFNKKLCDFACEQFDCTYYTKEKLAELLKVNKVDIKLAKLHDVVYAANHCKAHYLGKGVPDERNLLAYTKQKLESEGDVLFVHFIAEMAKKGIPIDWEEMI